MDNHQIIADKLVVKLLYEHKELRYSQIRNMLEENGIKYADHKGFDLVLERLQNKQLIIKKERNKSRRYPTYSLQRKGFYDLQLNAEVLSDILVDVSEYFLEERDHDVQKELILNCTNVIGLYVLLCYLYSWKFVTEKNNPEEFYKIREIYLNETLSSENMIDLIHVCTKKLFPQKCSKVALKKGEMKVIEDRNYKPYVFDNFNLDVEIINKKEFTEQVHLFQEKISNMLKNLEKVFSEEMELANIVMENLPHEVRNQVDFKKFFGFYKSKEK